MRPVHRPSTPVFNFNIAQASPSGPRRPETPSCVASLDGRTTIHVRLSLSLVFNLTPPKPRRPPASAQVRGRNHPGGWCHEVVLGGLGSGGEAPIPPTGPTGGHHTALGTARSVESQSVWWKDERGACLEQYETRARRSDGPLEGWKDGVA